MSPVHVPWYQQNLLLIGMAAVLCIAGAVATSRFFRRMTVVDHVERGAWLFLTALASGVTIWCAHFVAMLGYHPSVPVGFDWGLTGASLALAVVGSAFAFLIAGGPRPTRGRVAAGGAVLGLVISSTHYLGMSAVEVSGMMSWNWPLVAVSVLFAIAGSVAALLVARSPRPQAMNLMAGLFALAVVLLHFTGMSAMSVMRNPGAMPRMGTGADTALAVTIAVLALVTIGAGVMAYVIDGQNRLMAMERLSLLALSDGLTGLPNRAHLNQRLPEEIERATRRGIKLGLAVIDVDGFKEINDLRGHLVGDEVLRALAARMRALVDASDELFVARMGGDEFMVLCQLEDPDTFPTLLAELRQTVCRALQIGNEILAPQISVGAAVFPDDATDAETLINNADLAMYRAKNDRLLETGFYDAGVDNQTRLRRGLVADLRGAISRGELFLNYQPQASVSSGETRGFEALLRWRHPQLGLVPPLEFIPLAESSGLILPIGEWVLRRACADAASWDPPYRLSVNISAVQLAEPDFADTVREVLDATGLAPERLELEVTETAIFADRDQALRTLLEVKELGVGMALDDFGVGYSSLDALRVFPFDRIKLDRSFFTDGSRQRTVALVETVLSLSRVFGMSVLAEGIESDDQLALLTQTGCDEAQGFLLGRPAPLADLVNSGEIGQIPRVMVRDRVTT